MAEETSRDLIRHIRASLADKGEFGLFLLERLDEAIANGVEQIEYDERVTKRGVKVNHKKKSIGRRQPSDEEVLVIYARVLKAYLIDLPEAAMAFEKQLITDYGVRGVIISMHSDLVPTQDADQGMDKLSVHDLLGDNSVEDLRTKFAELQNALKDELGLE